MNKQLLWVIIAVLIIAVFAAPVKNFMAKYKTDGTEPAASQTTAPTMHEATALSEHSADTGGGYWLREYEGEVAVFYDDASKPEMTTGISTAGLRSNDRAALIEGIFAGTKDEVSSLLEDLGS